MDLWWVDDWGWRIPALAGLYLVTMAAVGLRASPAQRPRIAVVTLGAPLFLALLPVLLAVFLALFVSEQGCAWVMGIGGCLPWVPTPPTV